MGKYKFMIYGWISVKKGLPQKNDEYYLCICTDPIEYFPIVCEYKNNEFVGLVRNIVYNNVMCWMEIPEFSYKKDYLMEK